MNDTVLRLKSVRRAMRPFVLFLYEIVREIRPSFVLEIGVRNGQSTKTILSALAENRRGRLVSIDVKRRLEEMSEGLRAHWELVVGNSHEKETYNKVSGREYPILLIDGDHTYEGVKKDFEMYGKLVKKGGLILMHDILIPHYGVKDFWKEIKYPKIELNYGVAGMGIVQKI